MKNRLILELLKKQNEKLQTSLNMVASSGFNFPYIQFEEYLTNLLKVNIPMEGYYDRRFYQGMGIFNELETYANTLAKKLVDYKYVNLHPTCGTNANLAVFFGLLEKGDKVLVPKLEKGGHLSHLSKLSVASKFFEPIYYDLDYETGKEGFDEIEFLMKEHKPKILVIGYSAWPLFPDFERARELCNQNNVLLMADIAHISGLVLSGLVNMVDYAPDVVTSTTYKTFCGSKGGFIMTNNYEIYLKTRRALFPGLQGTTDVFQLASKVLSLELIEEPWFRGLMEQITENSYNFAQGCLEAGLSLACNGTETHMVIVRVPQEKEQFLAEMLENAGVVANKNMGAIRFGTISNTIRGLDSEDHKKLGKYIGEAIKSETVNKKVYNFICSLVQKQLRLEEVTERLKVIGCKPI